MRLLGLIGRYATHSSGGGVYSLQHTWNVSLLQDTSGSLSTTALEAFLLTSSPNASTVQIPRNLIPTPSGAAYNPSAAGDVVVLGFGLIVASQYGGWSTAASATVTTYAWPSLVVSIMEGTTQMTAHRPRQLHITAQVVMPSRTCAEAAGWPEFNINDPSVPVSLQWAIVRSDGTVDPEQATLDAAVASQLGRELTIPPGLLTAGMSYDVSVNANVTGAANVTGGSAAVRVDVSESPLTVLISGGEWRGAASDTMLTLDASASSYDPDNSTTALAFTWTCTQVGLAGIDPDDALASAEVVTGPPCVNINNLTLPLNSAHASAGVLHVPGQSLPPSTVLRFAVVGSLGSRSASDWALVEVASSAAAPTVSIDYVRQPSLFEPSIINLYAARSVRKSLKVTVSATATDSGSSACNTLVHAASRPSLVECRADYWWREVSGALNLSDTSVCPSGRSTSRIVILPYILQSGARYTLELTVTRPDATAGRAIVTIRVPRAPWGGQLNHFPTAGVLSMETFKLEDPVKLSMAGWTAEPDQLPLLYSFDWRQVEATDPPDSDACLLGQLASTPIAGRQASGDVTVLRLPPGNISVLAVVESAESGSQSCSNVYIPIEILNNGSLTESLIRSAAEDTLTDLLVLSAHRGLPQDILSGIDSLASLMNSQPFNASGGDDNTWRTYLRSMMLDLIVENQASSAAPAWRKLQQARAARATVASPSDISDASALTTIQFIRNTTGVLRMADASSGIQDSLLAALGDISRTDFVFSPPPPPPTPPPVPSPPILPDAALPPPFPPLWPPLAPAPEGGYSPPAPMSPVRTEACFFPFCRRLLDADDDTIANDSLHTEATGNTPGRRISELSVWGSRSSELRSAAAEIADYQAADLAPGDAQANAGSGSRISLAVKKDYAAARLPWELMTYIRPLATVCDPTIQGPPLLHTHCSLTMLPSCPCFSRQVVELDDILLQVDEEALANHLASRGYTQDWSLLMRLASYEQTPQQPPGPYDKVTPAPELASPLASMTLRNQGSPTPVQDVVSANRGGEVELTPASSISSDIYGVSRFDVGSGMFVRLPRLIGLTLDAACADDDECLGISDRVLSKVGTLEVMDDGSRRRSLRNVFNEEPETYSNSGQCVDQTCQCPQPWTGPRCERRFECLWWDPGDEDWQGSGCELMPEMSTDSHFICNCTLVGSADVQVVVRQVVADPYAVSLNVIRFTDVQYFANLETNYIPIVVISIVDGLYLFGMILAFWRSNEKRLRKYDRHYKFWREQHALRAPHKKPSWFRKTWNQLKGQHKFLRVFFQKYDLGEDPFRLHTGAQKLTVLWIVVLMKMTVSSMLSQTSAASGNRQNTVWQDVLLRVIIGLISASISLPASVVLDQLFWKQQRMTNKRQMHDEDTTEVQLIARAALHCTLNLMDTQQVIMRWRLAMEELKVDEIRQKLHAHRFGRLTHRQEQAASQKNKRELGRVMRFFEATDRGTSQFNLIGSAVGLQSSSKDEKVELLVQEAAARIQRRFRLWVARRQRKKRLLIALRVGRAWHRRFRDARGDAELDSLIEAEAVRIQRALRFRSHYLRHRATTWSNLLSTLRPRVASPRNQARKGGWDELRNKLKDACNPGVATKSATQGALIVASTTVPSFDPSSWFAPDESSSARKSAVKWVDDPPHIEESGTSASQSRVGPTAPLSHTPSTASAWGFGAIEESPCAITAQWRANEQASTSDTRVALPGALAEPSSVWGYGSTAESHERFTNLAGVHVKKPEGGSRLSTANSAYQLVPRSAGSSARSVSVGEVFVGSETSTPRRSTPPAPAEMTYASISQRLKRGMAIYNSDTRQALAARAHILATRRANVASGQGPKLLTAPSPVPPRAKLVTPAPEEMSQHTPLMEETFENVRAVDFSFQLWKDIALPVGFLPYKPTPPKVTASDIAANLAASEAAFTASLAATRLKAAIAATALFKIKPPPQLDGIRDQIQPTLVAASAPGSERGAALRPMSSAQPVAPGSARGSASRPMSSAQPAAPGSERGSASRPMSSAQSATPGSERGSASRPISSSTKPVVPALEMDKLPMLPADTAPPAPLLSPSSPFDSPPVSPAPSPPVEYEDYEDDDRSFSASRSSGRSFYSSGSSAPNSAASGESSYNDSPMSERVDNDIEEAIHVRPSAPYYPRSTDMNRPPIPGNRAAGYPNAIAAQALWARRAASRKVMPAGRAMHACPPDIAVATHAAVSLPGSEDGSEEADFSVGGMTQRSNESERKPLTPRPKERRRSVLQMTSKATSFSTKKVKEAAASTLVVPDIVADKVAKHAPGPLRRCCSELCGSVLFWRTFPWAMAYTLATFCHVQTLFVTMRIFAEFEDPIAMGWVWIQAIGVSMGVGWFVQDPIIIMVRNNLNCTKAIIRSKKYQVLEKFVVAPFRLAVNQGINCIMNLCGGSS